MQISRGMSALLKNYYGRGPRRVTTYTMRDVVLVMMEGGFNPVEETLLQAGRADAVNAQRDAFQTVMLDRFTEVIERATGRKVIAFMSATHQHPDLQGEIFVLETYAAAEERAEAGAPADTG